MELLPIKLDDEDGRIKALKKIDALTHGSEASFQHITDLLKLILDVEMVTLSLITEDKQILKARKGLDLKETPRSLAFCNIAIRKYEPLVIEDTLEDERVCDSPLVTGPPFLRCYIGAPLTTADGYNIGTICAFGPNPRRFAAREVEMLAKFSQLVMNQLELRSQANYDFLTEVSNRRCFISALEKEMERLCRSKGKATIAYLDIDYFKQVNDTYGHAMGDRVLHEFAQLIVASSREIDLVSRLGGEEFAVLLLDTDLDAAHSWAERVRNQVAETVFDGDTALRLTVSIGLSLVDETLSSPDEALTAADTALYDAKRQGRNRVSVS